MEWQARQPRVSNSCLPCSALPGFCLGRASVNPDLPQIRRDRLDLMIGQAEIRHLGRRPEIGRLLQPHRNPVRIQLEPDVFQVRPDFLHVLHQAVSLKIKLLNLAIDFAVGHSKCDRLLVQTGWLRRCSMRSRPASSGRPKFSRCRSSAAQTTSSAARSRSDLPVPCRSLRSDGSPCIRAGGTGICRSEICSPTSNQPQMHIGGVAGLAAGFGILFGKQRP